MLKIMCACVCCSNRQSLTLCLINNLSLTNKAPLPSNYIDVYFNEEDKCGSHLCVHVTILPFSKWYMYHDFYVLATATALRIN